MKPMRCEIFELFKIEVPRRYFVCERGAPQARDAGRDYGSTANHHEKLRPDATIFTV